MINHAEPDMSRDRLRGDAPRVRACLRCKAEFRSEWSGERICRRCKSSTSWRNGLPLPSKASGRR
jgi:hypothetical protein